MNKFEQHIREHQAYYLALGVGIGAAGITWFIMRERTVQMPSVKTPEMQSVTGSIRSFSFLSRTNNENIVSVLEREGRGHPGYLVRHIESGDTYENQGVAARAIGVYPSIMSQHVRGLRDNANGEHFERLIPKKD